MISDNQSYVRQQQTQPPQDYSAPLDMSGQANAANTNNYQASMFDPQSFPPLQPNIYDGTSDLDFGFSDFFGGYSETDFMLA
jgi:hypothetical protein